MSHKVVVLVDTSGSMSGDRIRNAKDAAKIFTESFGTKEFFTFSNDIKYHSSESKFMGFFSSGGTCIEKCLSEMFQSRIKGNSNQECTFYIITDACDRINNQSNVRRLRDECAKQFKEFYTEAILIGNSGQCSSELKHICGDLKIYSGQGFNKNIGQYANDVKKVNVHANTTLPALKKNVKKIQDISQHTNNVVVKQAAKKAQVIQKKVEEYTKKIDDLEIITNKVKKDVEESAKRAPVIDNDIGGLDKISDEDAREEEVEKIEDSIFAEKKKLSSKTAELKNGEKAAQEIQESIKSINKECIDIANKLRSSANSMCQQAGKIMQEISTLVEDLNKVSSNLGQTQKISSLSKQFNNQLNQLQNILINNNVNDLSDKLMDVQQKLQKPLRKLKQQKGKMEDMKKEIIKNLNVFNKLMNKLIEKA